MIIFVKSIIVYLDFIFCVILIIWKYENVFVMVLCYCLGMWYILLKFVCKIFFYYILLDIYIDRSLSYILKKIKEYEKFMDLYEYCLDFIVVVKIMVFLYILYFLFN